MKTIISTILLLFFYNNNFAQSKNSDEEYVIKFVLTDSSELYGYDYAKEIPSWDEMRSTIDHSRNFGETGSSYYYFDQKGKVQTLDFDKIDTIIVTDGSFCLTRLDIPNYDIFWNKVVENEKYILYDAGKFFMIYDKKTDGLLKQNYTGHSQPGNYGLKKDIKMLEENIKPYFSDCKGFIDRVNANLTKENYTDKKPMQTTGYRLFKGIGNYQCD
jgi:hypothetical protein